MQSNEQLIETFFERLTQQEDLKATKPEPRVYDRLDYRKQDSATDEGYCSEDRDLERDTSRQPERYQLTQYAGSARLMTDVDFSDFLRR